MAWFLLEPLGGDDLHGGEAPGQVGEMLHGLGQAGRLPSRATTSYRITRRHAGHLRPAVPPPTRRAPDVDHVMVPTHDVVRKGWRLGGVAARGPGARLAPVPAPSRAVPARAEPGARPRPDRPHSGRRRPRRVTWTSGARVEALDASLIVHAADESHASARWTIEAGMRAGGSRDEAGASVRPVDDRSGYAGRGRRSPGTTRPSHASAQWTIGAGIRAGDAARRGPRPRAPAAPGPAPCVAWTNPP